MAIDYSIRALKNFNGEGLNWKYVKADMQKPMSQEKLEQQIAANCTVTPSDIRAVLASLYEVAADELAAGRMFHIPEIGSLSLKIAVDNPDQYQFDKVSGKDIRVKNILFRPEKKFLDQVKKNSTFTRSSSYHESKDYTVEDVKKMIVEYTRNSPLITTRVMNLEFGIRKTRALKFLKYLVDTGFLIKYGPANSPVYMLAKERSI